MRAFRLRPNSTFDSDTQQAMSINHGQAGLPALRARLLRHSRFSLRALLVAVTLSALPAAWVGMQLRAQRDERATLSQLAKFDWVHYRWDVPDVSPLRWLQPLRKRCPFLKRVVYLSIGDEQFSDADLPMLDIFLNLRDLSVSGPQITDRGLRSIARRHPRLCRLSLLNCNVSDGGLAPLKNLSELKTLRIYQGEGGLTDACVPSIAECTQIEELSMFGTDITDSSLCHFALMPCLRNLDLSYTNCTDDAILKFEKRNPQIMVGY